MNLRLSTLSLILLCPICLNAGENSWPGFRNQGNSISKAENLPLHWSPEEGIQWRKKLAGFGQSSPVINKGMVWVTATKGSNKETLIVEAFDLKSGERKVHSLFDASVTVPEVTKMISQGAPTPAIDDSGVYVFFESGDLFALTLEGEVAWHRSIVDEFGPFVGGHGVGSSLVQNEDNLFLLIDHDGPSHLFCIDKSNGQTVWDNQREPRVSWTTPLLFEAHGKKQIVVSSNGGVHCYDQETGTLQWNLSGFEGNNVPSPTWTGDLLLIGSSSPQQCQAIQISPVESNGKTVLNPEVAWKAGAITSSFGSPLAYKGLSFFVNRAGVLQAVRLKDGSTAWETRLPASTWASPVSAGGFAWFFCQNGKTVILSPDETGPGEPIAENDIGISEEERVYGVAIVDGVIVVRTGTELIAIGN